MTFKSPRRRLVCLRRARFVRDHRELCSGFGFGERPALRLIFGALIRAEERSRGLRFAEFELRQTAAGKIIPAPRFLQVRA
jgi:hypothetical protein